MAAQRSGSLVARSVAVLALVVGLLLGAAPAGWAVGTPQDLPRAVVLEFHTSLADFGDAVGEGPFVWATNGCSTPNIKELAKWNHLFVHACTRHDFAYDNFGHGGGLETPNEPRRAAVDAQLRTDMYGICAPLSWLKAAECRLVASAYYTVVRKVGGIAYYY
jgi:hypothetical protein